MSVVLNVELKYCSLDQLQNLGDLVIRTFKQLSRLIG